MRQQREQEEFERQEREQQERLMAEKREKDRQLREQQQTGNVNATPQAIANQPSPFITPLHATPEQTIADSSTQITPGQGTPVTMASAIKADDANPINPVFQSTKDDTFSKTYEEMEQELNEIIAEQYQSCQSLMFPGIQELSQDQHKRVKESSFVDSIRVFMRQYKEHEMFRPFMEERERRLKAIKRI